MRDQDNGQTPTGNTDDEPFTPTPIITLPEQRVMTDKGTGKSDDVQTDTKKKLHWLEVGYFSSQIILAGIGIWALTIYHGQMVVMQGQLDEMRRGGEQSTQQMWSAIGNVNWMARSMDWNQKDSHNSIQATINQFHQDQRAWIEPIAFDLINDMHAPDPIKAQITIVNYGKTPALNTIFRCVLMASDSPLKDIRATAAGQFERITGKPEGFGAIFPNVHNPIYASTGTTNEQGILEVRNGKKILYLFVWATYNDVFNKPHTTKFCAMYQSTKGPMFSECPQKYDYAD